MPRDVTLIGAPSSIGIKPYDDGTARGLARAPAALREAGLAGRLRAEEVTRGRFAVWFEDLEYLSLLDREGSWWNPKAKTNAEWVLRHEQLHFAITELAARRGNAERERHAMATKVVADSPGEAMRAFIKQRRVQNDWLLPGQDSTPMRPRSWQLRLWNPLFEDGEVRRRNPHMLRHTYASLLTHMGESLLPRPPTGTPTASTIPLCASQEQAEKLSEFLNH